MRKFLHFSVLIVAVLGAPAAAAHEAGELRACLDELGTLLFSEADMAKLAGDRAALVARLPACAFAEGGPYADRFVRLIAAMPERIAASVGAEPDPEAAASAWRDIVALGWPEDMAIPADDEFQAAELRVRTDFDQYITKSASGAVAGSPDIYDCRPVRIVCLLMFDATRIDNAIRLAQVLAANDALTAMAANPELARSIFLITQHADRIEGYQKAGLDILRAAHARGLVDGQQLSLLEDRVMAAEEGRQIYGTQTRCGANGAEIHPPLLDPDRLDALRNERGLIPIDDYLGHIEKFCAARR